MQGLILSSALYGRCLMHINYTLSESKADCLNYDFWMHHYYINESVNYVTFAPLVKPNSHNSTTEHNLLFMNANIQAVLICLHHAAVMRFAKTNTPQAPSSESEIKCLKAALEITNMTRRIRSQMDPANVSPPSFSSDPFGVMCLRIRTKLCGLKMSPFIPWSIYVAAQVYVRALHAYGEGSGLPITPIHTPTTASFSPQSYFNFLASPGASGSSGSGQGVYTSMPSFSGTTSHCSFPPLDNQGSTIPTSRIGLLESIDCLLGTLASLKTVNLIAGVFEAQIRYELNGGKTVTDDRLVGRVDFPLDGQQTSADLADHVTKDVWGLL